MTHGLHHISSIASHAQHSYDFYTNVLGLRFVKRTVNQDAVDTYHLYWGNETGEPGTAMTMFIFPDAGTGTRGPGMATRISFAVPKTALGFWLARFVAKGVKHSQITEKFGHKTLEFFDQDGQLLELVATDDLGQVKPWVTAEISDEVAIHGFHGVELSVDNYESTGNLLTEYLGYKKIDTHGNLHRYENPSADFAKYIDLFHMPGWPAGRVGAGTVHHVAFRVPDSEAEMTLREEIVKQALHPTPQIDRFYFKSVYFREPNGVLFELATDEPGFTVDEDKDELGLRLVLPPKFAEQRKEILVQLPDLHVADEILENENLPEFEFKHRFLRGESDKTLLLLHGTGADENDLIPLAQALVGQTTRQTVNLLSLRGNVNEDGLLRFFERNEDGFVRESIDTEVAKLQSFLLKARDFYKLDLDKFIFIGYSNGANFAASHIFTHPGVLKQGLLLHPMLPFEPELTLNLKDCEYLVTSGQNDPYPPEGSFDSLVETLEQSGAVVEKFVHPGGHELNDAEVSRMRKFLKQLID